MTGKVVTHDHHSEQKQISCAFYASLHRTTEIKTGRHRTRKYLNEDHFEIENGRVADSGRSHRSAVAEEVATKSRLAVH
jgi:hypothetical protein